MFMGHNWACCESMAVTCRTRHHQGADQKPHLDPRTSSPVASVQTFEDNSQITESYKLHDGPKE
jgi:hypothetical protein